MPSVGCTRRSWAANTSRTAMERRCSSFSGLGRCAMCSTRSSSIAREIDEWYDEIEGDPDDHDRWLPSQSREDIKRPTTDLKALIDRKDREAGPGNDL